MTRLQTPPSGGHCASGWLVGEFTWAGGTVLTHAGSNTMWYATVWIAPGKNLILAVVTNRGDDVAQGAGERAITVLFDAYAD